MKGRSPNRLKSELSKRLLQEVDLSTVAHDIAEFLETRAGKAAQGKNLTNILAAYLAQKYSFIDLKGGELRRLIERHTDDLAAFLDQILFKKFQALFKTPAGPPEPISLNKLAQALLKTPVELPPLADEPPRRKKKRRPRPKNEAERARRRKISKDDFEWRRRQYRDGLIVKQFGTFSHLRLLDPNSTTCLDLLFGGGGVRMAGHWDSLENLFGVYRKRFPKSLPHKRDERCKRKLLYYLDAFLTCLVHLLAKQDAHAQWLPEGPQRDLVLTGIIARARHFSSKVANALAKRLRPYLP